MNALAAVGAIMVGVGAAILTYGFPERRTRNPGPTPKPPRRCDLCGGGGVEYDENGDYHPCRWRCWDNEAVAA